MNSTLYPFKALLCLLLIVGLDSSQSVAEISQPITIEELSMPAECSIESDLTPCELELQDRWFMSRKCNGELCTYSCLGEWYDIDGNLENGCEVRDSPVGGHSTLNPTDLGVGECQSPAFDLQLSGLILSDRHQHPSLSLKENATTDDWFSITPAEGCEGNLSFQFITTGGFELKEQCYQATFFTNMGSYSLSTSGEESVILKSEVQAIYNSGTIYIKVEKLLNPTQCLSNANEQVTYFINFRLSKTSDS